jgi:cystathionine beta-synthase
MSLIRENTMAIYHSVTELIGHTPLIQLHKLDAGPCSLFLKLENQNPGGSIKDRVALSMIDEAERQGLLAPGGTIIEATAGNTGLGLALIAAQKGYALILVVPDKMSREKIFHLRALGAQVVLTRSDVNKGHPAYYQDYATRLAKELPGAFYIDQFNNKANPLAHSTTTAPELFEQLEGHIDAIVVGVGSGGTLGGLQTWFAEHSPHTEFVLADPAGSVLADQVESGRFKEAGSWLVEGIGEDFIPPLAHIEGVQRAYRITDREAFTTARDLLKTEGILAGSSSGTLLAAALRYCQAQTTPKRVVTFACDSGNKYLSKMFNDDWMRQQGLITRPQTGDLSDYIALRHDEGATVTAAPDDTLATVLARMRLYDISQLPVLDNGTVVGIVDEWDLVSHIAGDGARFALPVTQAMTRSVDVLDKSASESELKPIFGRGQVAVINDRDRFLGLITRSDVLTVWRNRLQQ